MCRISWFIAKVVDVYNTYMYICDRRMRAIVILTRISYQKRNAWGIFLWRWTLLWTTQFFFCRISVIFWEDLKLVLDKISNVHWQWLRSTINRKVEEVEENERVRVKTHYVLLIDGSWLTIKIQVGKWFSNHFSSFTEKLTFWYINCLVFTFVIIRQ